MTTTPAKPTAMPMRSQRRHLLAEEDGGEQRHDDRTDLHDERGRAGVDAALGLVEGEVVDAEPAHAAEQEQRPVTAGRPGARPAEDEHPERDGRDEQPAQRQRPGRHVASEVPDRDESRRPQQERHGHGGEHEHPRASVAGRGL